MVEANLDWTTFESCAGINPDGSQYQVEDMRKAMSNVLGHLPGVECNKDQSGSRQLYQVYICVSSDGTSIIDCPVLPRNECKGSVEFPVFNPSSTNFNSRDLSVEDVNTTKLRSEL